MDVIGEKVIEIMLLDEHLNKDKYKGIRTPVKQEESH